ncbi:MAG: hypothetical protein LLF76_02910 [Planctomycetaceae bacterium]|nr:hypothetical protein [Planctomycetaceae bacterium]
MQRVRFLFHRAKMGDGHAIDDGINLWTTIWNPGVWFKPFLRSSHAEVWQPYDDCFTVAEYKLKHGHIQPWMKDRRFIGRCYTSTMGAIGGMNRKGNGVVVRPAHAILDQHPNRWYFYETEITTQALATANTWANKLVLNNPGYGLAEIASFFLPWRINTPRMICSEFTSNWAAQAGLPFGDNKVPEPVKLSLRIYAQGYIPLDLDTETCVNPKDKTRITEPIGAAP